MWFTAADCGLCFFHSVWCCCGSPAGTVAPLDWWVGHFFWTNEEFIPYLDGVHAYVLQTHTHNTKYTHICIASVIVIFEICSRVSWEKGHSMSSQLLPLMWQQNESSGNLQIWILLKIYRIWGLYCSCATCACLLTALWLLLERFVVILSKTSKCWASKVRWIWFKVKFRIPAYPSTEKTDV